MDSDLSLSSNNIGGTLSETLGATPLANGQTRFAVWAPEAQKVCVELVLRTGDVESVSKTYELNQSGDGVFIGLVDNCSAGTLYRLKPDDKDARPDPRSRFQPFGVHGPSQVVDPSAYKWKDTDWKGIKKRDLVIYELHIGSFSKQGTYAAAIAKFDELKQLGVTAIEVLPLAQCPGKWNWGYDGVNYFAPSNNFGTPDDLKAFVDACHQNGFAVFIDVVYNHVGPEGNYFSEFGPYRSKGFGTPWGDAFAFDLAPVRQYVIDNILFWVDEYHFDGLRLDAVHYMFDDSDKHILTEIAERFAEHSTKVAWQTHLIGESNIYDAELVGEKVAGKPCFDAIWSDCLMHSIYKAGAPELRLTNRHYKQDDIAQTLEHAYVFCAPKAIRATEAVRFENHPESKRDYISSLIMALQTHDSVGNHPHGKRIHELISVEYQMAAAPLVLLYPSIPMIWMGEEWATDAPFPFFADFEDGGLRKAVDKGRRDEYPHHDWTGSPLPSDPAAFTNSKSKPEQQKQVVFDWYRKLLKFRKSGIENGWLTVENWSTTSDLQTGMHQMVYQHPDGELHICSRLAREGVDATSLSDLKVGKVLFNSKPDQTDQLSGEHCLIWIG